MDAVLITKEDVRRIVHSIKITFVINCAVTLFIFISNGNSDIIALFFASQSIGLTTVGIIETAKVLHPPLNKDNRKLLYFLPVPVFVSSFIGINFIHGSATLPELIVLVTIITIPIMLLFQYMETKITDNKKLSFQENRFSVADKALQANKLLLLQAQINPHFLFNTLENIKQYINSEPKKAEHLLTDYTFFLRQTLPSTQTTEGTVKDELALINAYIAIQQTRFPYVRFIQVIDERLHAYSLPPLLLQPLVENAIVHGLAPQGHQGLITLTITTELQQLLIEVNDTGVGFDPQKVSNNAMAIKNIKARLALHHPLANLKIMAPDHGTTVKIIIPLYEL